MQIESLRSLQKILNDSLKEAVYPEFDKLRETLQGVDPLLMQIDEFNRLHGMDAQIEQMQADIENCPDRAIEQWCDSLKSFNSTIDDCDSNYYIVQRGFEFGMLAATALALQWLEVKNNLLTREMRSQIRSVLDTVYSD